MERRIVILTRSAMHGAYCVAGLDIQSGEWVRLVSDENGSSLDKNYTAYRNTIGQCRPLDVVRVNIIARVPVLNQQENCLISAGSMSKIGTFRIPQFLQLHPAENHQYVFGNESRFLTEEDMRCYRLNYSLIFIHVQDLIFTISDYNKSKANFTYNGIQYKYMSVTDPKYFAEKIADGTKFRNAYLVVSMPKDPYKDNGCYYKFIAKVFPA